MLKKAGLIMDVILRTALHAAILFLAFSVFSPAKSKAPARMIQALWTGSDQTYIQPGSQFKIFKPYLRDVDRVSLILDLPNNSNVKTKETSYDAQNYLAPDVINLETVEPVALVYCSTQALADQRLLATGYVWERLISPGKGIAKKKS